MLQFEIKVAGVLIDGHPSLILGHNLEVMKKIYNRLVEKYPYNKVTLTQYIPFEKYVSIPLERPIAVCPRGHTGLDYKMQPIVRQDSNNLYICTLCGWKEGDLILSK